MQYVVDKRDRVAQRLAPDHTLLSQPPRFYVVEADSAMDAIDKLLEEQNRYEFSEAQS